MKKIYSLLFTTFLVTLLVHVCSLKSQAQPGAGPWDLASDLFSQMDEQTFNNFVDNFGNANPGDINFGENNESLQELFDLLGDNNPAGNLDESFLDVWGPGFDLLQDGISGFDLQGFDEDAIFDQYGNLENIFASNFDSLGGLYGQYQDSLAGGITNWEINVIGLDDLTDQSFAILQDTFDQVFGDVDPTGPEGLSDIIAQIFDVVLFPDLELAFGTQNASLKYYDDRYDAKARVLRVGSVPRFDREASTCDHGPVVPIEARWHIQGSWVGEVDRNEPLNTSSLNERGASPLLFSGDFAMMATPTIGSIGNTTFKLITSLGMEFGTYAPAHRDYRAPFTAGNRGFATGFGPQAGTGFAWTAGPLTVYSYGTLVVGGEMLRCGPRYKYDSRRFEAGIRYGNIINVRYSSGKVAWQPDDNRRAKINHQVTVGIILQELHP